MPHFLINSRDIKNNKIIINDKDLYKHIIRVMRMRKGEALLLIDENEIQYETIIENTEESSIVCTIEKQYKSTRKLETEIYLAQSVLNSDNQISIIKKATEIGAKGIIPLYTDNCAVKESIIRSKTDKWQKVANESVKQCERADIPKVYEMTYIKEAVKDFEQIYVFAEKYAECDFIDYIKENKLDKKKKILIIIGPEGGFSEKEFEFFKAKNIPLITLGNLIYRADTAAAAAMISVILGVKHG